MATAALNPLVEKVRAKYPGAYDDMDDAALTKALLAKYPQYSDLAAPSATKAPGAPAKTLDSGEGPIASNLTSFETQIAKAPEAIGSFLKSASHGFPEDTAEHERVLRGEEPTTEELTHALSKINPIVRNSEGIDYGATAANLLPFLLKMRSGETAPTQEVLPPEQGLPPRMPPKALPETAAAEPAPKITQAGVERQLRQALGVQELKPGVPLKDQLTAKPAATTPEAVQANPFKTVDSSALKSYRYSPDTREFETITKGGQHYIYGDVSPDDVQAFEKADSKGKAWQGIRNNPLVAKVINGKRVAVKPVASEDLTDILQRSIDALGIKR